MKMTKNNRKKALIIGGVVLGILLIAFIILFVFPAFNNNKYGDRLDDIEEHEIPSSDIDDITSELENQEGVKNVSYHDEGRILNFIMTVDPSLILETAQGYSSIILDGISKDNKSYYDIQLYIKADGDSDVYPVIGYKSKNNDEMTFGNTGGSSE